MRTAREIIAGEIGGMAPNKKAWFECVEEADAILAALAAEGFSIVETGRDPVTVEACAKVATKVLEDEAHDLESIRDSYIVARKTGKHAGRRIPDEMALQFAGDFRSRSDAVFQVLPFVVTAIRALSRSTREGKTE